MHLLRKLAYSSGALASAVVAQAFSTYVIFFYVDTLKMPAKLIGLGMALYGVWNAINDPLAGHISDRTRTRWGRRIPYMLFGSLPLAVAFALVWMPPLRFVGDNEVLLFAYFIAIIFLFDTLYTFVILNWTSLFPEMFISLKERTQVSAFRQLFGIFGLIVGIAAPPLVYGSLGWPAMGAIFAAVTAAFLYLSVWGARERGAEAVGEPLPFRSALRYTFANRSFLTYVLASFLVQFTFVTLTATLPFYAKYVLRIDEGQTSLLFLSVFLTALVFLALWSRVTVRLGARKAMMMSVILFGAALTPFWLASSFAAGVATGALVGIGLAGIMLLLDILISDVIDEDELRTGTRREGMYFGVNGFVIRLGISLQAVVMSVILDSTGYDPNLVVQPPSAITGLRLLVTAVPLAALVVSLLALYFYPLHGERLKAVKAAREG